MVAGLQTLQLTQVEDNAYCPLSPSTCGDTPCSGLCNPAGNLWRRLPGWTTTAAPVNSVSHCSWWCLWERWRGLWEHSIGNSKTVLKFHNKTHAANSGRSSPVTYILGWSRTVRSHRCSRCRWHASCRRCPCSVVCAEWRCISCKAPKVLGI